MPSIEHEYFPYSYDDRQKGKLFLHGDHFKYCLHSPKKKKRKKQKRNDLLFHVYIKRIIILHAIETIHIAWMKKVLRNLPKNVSKFDMYYNNSMRCVLLCCVGGGSGGGGGGCTLCLDLIQ